MEDIFVSVIAKLAEYTVGPILHHVRYLCCFNSFVGNLRNDKKKLELTQNSLKEQVEEAIKRTEKVEPTVEKWLKEVEEVLEEVDMLEGRISEVSKSCFKRQCQYFLAKKIARKIEKMTQLNRDSKFDPFSKITELPGMKYFSSKDFVFFKSTETTYKELLEALRDKSVCKIGLVGLGGSGKTTLAKEVGKKAEEFKLFEKVVMATVSQTLDIKSIQEQIADNLGFKLQEESKEGRAKRLSQRLREGTILLILDDVWEKLNFEALGIPFNENNQGCRVLLTTRSKQVCTSMQCQSIIELNLLASEEAWDLFQLYANITTDSLAALKVVARKIVNECKGLPIAVVTVGSTLKGKTIEEWESALSRLEDSKPLDIPKGLTSPHVCLRLSYDNLTNELAKSLLLLCSTFPEDHKIDLEDLFRFGRGLGLIRTFGTLEKSRREMHVAVNILMNSCLLLHANNKERVKMHDMVRDVALWIASEMGQPIFARSGMDPKMLEEDETIKDKRVISLWDLKNSQLSNDDQLNCPSLEILLFHSTEVGFEVSNTCLERLKMIKILAFLTAGYKWGSWYTKTPSWKTFSLPQSIESLKNLHTLCLRGFGLGDISILESLQTLEILDLRGSFFNELPNGITLSKKLKLLDLFQCSIVERNAYEVIGRCLQLNELYLYINSYVYEEFPHNVSFSGLQRYVLIYKMYPWHVMTDILEEHRPTRVLCIDGFDASAQSFISLPIKNLFLRAEYLQLKYLKGGYKNVIPSMDPQGMNQLMFLRLESCSEIECLFDTNVDVLQFEDVAFSSLVTLYLYDMSGLQEVFCDSSSRCSLNNLQELIIQYCSQLHCISFPRNSKLCHLKVLKIGGCPMLTCLFMPSIVQTLVLLEVLSIYNCSELKHIIGEEEGNVDYVTSSQSDTSLMLSKLRTLRIERCDRLGYVFPVCLASGLASLEDLSISKCNNLKFVFGNEKEHHQTNIHINFLNLKYVWLDSLPNLVSILRPHYYPPCLPNLERLVCTDCPKLCNFYVHKTVIDSDLQQDPTLMEKEILLLIAITFNQLCDHMFSPKLMYVLKLTYLELSGVGVKGIFQFSIEEPTGSIKELVPLNMNIYGLSLLNLPEVKFIWKGPRNFVSLQMLDSIWVEECPKLKTIFSPTIVKSLPMLTRLHISSCKELEQIFESGDEQVFRSQQPCFPKLHTIKVRYCNKLKCFFYNFVAVHFSSLTTLEIEECSQLEKVFAFESEADDDGQEMFGKDGEQLVLLQNLKDIKLISMSNFKEIHHGFKLTYDVEQTIIGCPKYAPNLYLHSDM